MEKENQRVRLTKLLLKDKLKELLTKKPINRVTVKEICQVAEINRSTFYQHYSDQYALLDDIESDIIKQTDEFIDKINPEQSGRQYLIYLLSYIRENGSILSILLSPQSSMTFQPRFMASVLKRISAKIEPVFFSSELFPYFSQFLIMGNISVIEQWIKNDFYLLDEEVADMIYRLSDSAMKMFISMNKK